jgi:hypothetical protein
VLGFKRLTQSFCAGRLRVWMQCVSSEMEVMGYGLGHGIVWGDVQ